MASDYTNTRNNRPRQSGVAKLFTALAFGCALVGALVAFFIDLPAVAVKESDTSICSCKVEMIIDTTGADWFYYDTPIDFTLEEEVEFLPAKQEGGSVMDP
ncbi:hypothetical protein [Parapedobacter koreensis]|uniref:Uncharacterized protein n=1 Tax=Parapedobacter koreensis TaxID=332977 RepID=A0A1H7Q245_9SPHI|nr:hypothetical protein [Parapedobacter koreensis]SEL41555.1 hypothetical protein SAMN05421740_105112 [Parapedobacter koreensis]